MNQDRCPAGCGSDTASRRAETEVSGRLQRDSDPKGSLSFSDILTKSVPPERLRVKSSGGQGEFLRPLWIIMDTRKVQPQNNIRVD